MKPKLKSVVTLATLAQQWLDAKKAEREANEARIAIETEIASRMPAKAEGTVTEDVAGCRVSCEYKLTRSVDSDRLQAAWPLLDPKVQGAFSWKASIKVGELRKVMEFMPDEYAEIAKMIEVKPAKTAVKVELIESEAA